MEHISVLESDIEYELPNGLRKGKRILKLKSTYSNRKYFNKFNFGMIVTIVVHLNSRHKRKL